MDEFELFTFNIAPLEDLPPYDVQEEPEKDDDISGLETVEPKAEKKENYIHI